MTIDNLEHPGWNESFAKRILEVIESQAVYRLPGYDKAPWTYDAVTA